MARAPCRSDFAHKIAKGLREFGYRDLKPDAVRVAIDAWIDDGKRGHDLPKGAIGYMVGRQLDELEETSPGRLALLDRG